MNVAYVVSVFHLNVTVHREYDEFIPVYMGDQGDYYLSKDRATAAEAVQMCRGIGPNFHLVTFEDEHEYRTLLPNLRSVEPERLWTLGKKAIDDHNGLVPDYYWDYPVPLTPANYINFPTDSHSARLRHSTRRLSPRKPNSKCRDANAAYRRCKQPNCTMNEYPCETITPQCVITDQKSCTIDEPQCFTETCKNCTVTQPVCHVVQDPCDIVPGKCSVSRGPCSIKTFDCYTERGPCQLLHPPCNPSTTTKAPCPTTRRPCVTTPRDCITTTTRPCPPGDEKCLELYSVTFCKPFGKCNTEPPTTCRPDAVICPQPFYVCPPERTICPIPEVVCPEPVYSCEDPQAFCPAPRVVCTEPKVHCDVPTISCTPAVVDCRAPQYHCGTPQVDCPKPQLDCEEPPPCVPEPLPTTTLPPCEDDITTPEPERTTTTEDPGCGCANDDRLPGGQPGGCIALRKDTDFKWKVEDCQQRFHFLCEGK
jgi:hypothetical protein